MNMFQMKNSLYDHLFNQLSALPKKEREQEQSELVNMLSQNDLLGGNPSFQPLNEFLNIIQRRFPQAGENSGKAN